MCRFLIIAYLFTLLLSSTVLILGFRRFKASLSFGYSCFFLEFGTPYVASFNGLMIFDLRILVLNVYCCLHSIIFNIHLTVQLFSMYYLLYKEYELFQKTWHLQFILFWEGSVCKRCDNSNKIWERMFFYAIT